LRDVVELDDVNEKDKPGSGRLQDFREDVGLQLANRSWAKNLAIVSNIGLGAFPHSKNNIFISEIRHSPLTFAPPGLYTSNNPDNFNNDEAHFP
jgi:hypothetical protein